MKFSIFKNLDGTHPGKSVSMVDGELVGKTIGQFSRARVSTEDLDLAGLATYIKTADSSVHLTAGVAREPESVALTSMAFQVKFHSQEFTDAETGLPLVTRTKASLPFPSGPAMLVIDCDGDADHLEELYQGNPVLRDYAHIETTSSSSMLFDSEGNQLKGKRGVHVIFHVANGEDIERTLNTLHARQIIAGYGKHKVSSDGRFLERSSVDLAMRTPNQPVYLYATTADGIEQRKEVRLLPGVEVLDTEQAIPSLSDAEEKALQDCLIQARIELSAKCDEVRKAWIEERVGDAIAKGMPEEAARKSVLQSIAKDGFLGPHFVVHLSDGRAVTVAEICRNPESYHGVACRDPMEPGYSSSAAKIFTNYEPLIHSMAHGSGRRFTLSEYDSPIDMDELQRSVDSWLERETAELRGKPELMRWLEAQCIVGLDKFAGETANDIVEAVFKGEDLPTPITLADCPQELGVGVEANGQIAILKFDIGGAVNYVSEIKAKDRMRFAQSWETKFMAAVDLTADDSGIDRFLMDPLKKALSLPIETVREEWITNSYLTQDRAKKAVNAILPKSDRIAEPVAPSPEDQQADALIKRMQVIQGWLDESRHVAENPLMELALEMERRGIAGENAIQQLTFLTAHSTFMGKPLAAAVKGQSSSGKSYVTTQTLKLYPPEFVYEMTGGSPKSLVYEEEEFCNRLVYLAEAEALVREQGTEHNDFAEILRVMVSEQKILYKYVAKDEAGKMVTMTAERKGPIAFLTTSVRSTLDPEMETRMLSAFSDESTEQTERITKGAAQQFDGTKKIVKNDGPFHAFAHWIRSGPNDAIVPFAQPLESLVPKNAVRVRRDFNSIVALIKISAIVHRLNRQTNDDGLVVAEPQDYQVAYDICREGFKVSAGSGLTAASIEMLEQLKTVLVYENWKDGLKPHSLVVESAPNDYTGEHVLCPFALAADPNLKPSHDVVRAEATRRQYVRHELQGTYASIGLFLGINEQTLRRRVRALKDAGFVELITKRGSGGTSRIWLTNLAASELDDGVELPTPQELKRLLSSAERGPRPWQQLRVAT